MDEKKPEMWYFYHKVGDKIVMDRALHTDHHKQAHRALGLPKPKYVAGTLRPLTDAEIKRYEGYHAATFDKGHRRDLPQFEEPEAWTRYRDDLAKRMAKLEAKKDDGRTLGQGEHSAKGLRRERS